VDRIFKRHKFFWSQKSFGKNVIFSVLLLAGSLVANYFANVYTTTHVSNPVSDIILDNLPVFNVRFMFVQGAIVFGIFVIILVLREPQRMPFVVKSVAIFILIRSLFIMLTHTALPPDHVILDPTSIFRFITAGDDMFFSSHTGLPFLLALIFWQNKRLRLFFIIVSFIFAVSVLMAHLHYSIDVFAAFFMSYSIFHIARRFFLKDYALFNESAAK